MNSRPLAALLVAILPSIAFCDSPPTGIPHDLGHRLRHNLESPWRADNAITLAFGGTLALIATRIEDPAGAANALENSALEGPIDAADLFGSGVVAGGGALVVTALGKMTGSGPLTDFGLDLTSGFLVSSAYTLGLKLAFDRTRPDGGPYSFPSGHTAVAFTMATVIDRHTSWPLSTLAYLVAAGTAAGRMEDRRHYLSDVVFGAALGLAVGDKAPLAAIIGHVSVGPDAVVVQQRF